MASRAPTIRLGPICCSGAGIMRWKWPSVEAAHRRNSKGETETSPMGTVAVKAERALVPWRYSSGCERMMTIHMQAQTNTVRVTESLVVLPGALLGEAMGTLEALKYILPLFNTPTLTNGLSCISSRWASLHTYSLSPLFLPSSYLCTVFKRDSSYPEAQFETLPLSHSLQS